MPNMYNIYIILHTLLAFFYFVGHFINVNILCIHNMCTTMVCNIAYKYIPYLIGMYYMLLLYSIPYWYLWYEYRAHPVKFAKENAKKVVDACDSHAIARVSL